MKDWTKFAVVGLVGYFVGFYEMKYKAMKALTNVVLDNCSKDHQEKEEEPR